MLHFNPQHLAFAWKYYDSQHEIWFRITGNRCIRAASCCADAFIVLETTGFVNWSIGSRQKKHFYAPLSKRQGGRSVLDESRDFAVWRTDRLYRVRGAGGGQNP